MASEIFFIKFYAMTRIGSLFSTALNSISNALIWTDCAML